MRHFSLSLTDVFGTVEKLPLPFPSRLPDAPEREV